MSTPYVVVRSEGCLWTVGFTGPDGTWQPDSDHDRAGDARVRAHQLNGIEARYVYRRSEPGLWTVGEYDGDRWEPEGDYASEDEAAERVIALNA